MNESLVVIGDALLDRDVAGRVERLAPDAPVPVLDEVGRVARPGGAGLAATLAARDGRAVTLITALAADEAGRTLRTLLEDEGVEVIDLGLDGPTPEKIRFRTDGRSLMRLDRGGTGARSGPVSATARAAVGWAEAVLVSDYGRGLATQPGLRAALAALPSAQPTVWDPHPRGPAPPPAVTATTPNEAEVARAVPEPSGGSAAEAIARAARLRERWEAMALCMTRGAAGALLVEGDAEPRSFPAPRVEHGDECGAGDRFASRVAGVLADGGSVSEAVEDAVACASAFVAAGGAAGTLESGPREPRMEADAFTIADRVRATGGTVVATGGCFDLLHAGHVRTLEAAGRLGDCLVICLNSDASVGRLKGPGRPLVPEQDRASVLAGLACVDGVVVFDEDTPEGVLERLRPHVWAKGGDYDGAELPEARALQAWDGRVEILPYFEGRSSTRLIEEAAGRA
jgi:rfaE bifunctional protein nucleotidyltransferase chain/domain/rfaE bifunctional protein kinase chain/domain